MPEYRTYVIDLNGSDSYFDSQDSRWYALSVLVKRGGQILHVLTVPMDRINRFNGWDGGEAYPGANCAHIPAIMIAYFPDGVLR